MSKQPTHIIDPEGEVIIVLSNANAPFAQPHDGLSLEPEESCPEEPIPAKLEAYPAEELYPAESAPAQPEVYPDEELYPAEPAPAESETYPAEELYPAEPAPYPTEEPAVYPNDETPADVPPAPKSDEDAVGDTAGTESDLELHDKGPFCIQVSAKHLMLASPYFKASLSGPWKESVGFLQKHSVEIPATDWDIEALLIILHVIHGQHYKVPRRITLEMLAKVAVLVDYYQCREAVSIWRDIWVGGLDETVPSTYCRDLLLWIWVSYVFKMPENFRAATSRTMSWSEGRIDHLGLIPRAIMIVMTFNREDAIEDVLYRLYDTREGFLSGSCGCNYSCNYECDSIMYGALTKEMRSANLLSPKPVAPYDKISYEGLVKKLKAFKSPSWYPSGRRHHSCSTSNFSTIFQDINDGISGLEVSRYHK
ncbi:hypothetical protein BJX64DRAFT_52791 [Aspergillus heterothallicus]